MTVFNQFKSLMLQHSNDQYTEKDVQMALSKEVLEIRDFAALLSKAAVPFLPQMTLRAQEKTKAHFGNAIQLFTPLYISNYCDNHCTYCGFSCRNDISREKLSLEAIASELDAIKATGLREILLLTGESLKHTPISYLSESVQLCKQNFASVGLEIMPLDTDQYRELHLAGADFVSIYQETYNESRYREVHRQGKKRDFHYRFNAQERAIEAGMHGVSFGALYGLDDHFKDALSVGIHAYLIQTKYPHIEIGFSFPRIRPIHSDESEWDHGKLIGEKTLFQLLVAFRLFMPYSTLTLSTRESAYFRSHACQYIANKLSAEAIVQVGGHAQSTGGEVQFEISDNRTVKEIKAMLIEQNLQPVFTNHLHLEGL